MSESKKTALVISGGGAKGAFAVGVLKFLFSEYGDSGWFAITGGTSTGALISPMAALMSTSNSTREEACETLVRVYTTVKTSDILKKRNIFQWICHQECLNTNDPLNNLIHREFRQEWFDWLKEDEAPHCYVTYVNYKNGMSKDVSPKENNISREEFIQAILASAGIPIIVKSTKIGGNACYDGGVRDLLPFKRAIDLGAETIIPIFLDPEKYPESDDPFKKFKEILLRTFSIMLDETGRNDHNIASKVNIAIRAKQALYDRFAGNQEVVDKIRGVLENDPSFAPLFGKRVINIIEGIKPDNPLTEDSTEFDPVKMREWMSQGETKASEIITENPFT